MIETKLSVKEIERIIVAYLGGVRTNIIVPNLSWGFFNHEADLISVDKNGYLTEVEIKRSFEDFKADFKKITTTTLMNVFSALATSFQNLFLKSVSNITKNIVKVLLLMISHTQYLVSQTTGKYMTKKGASYIVPFLIQKTLKVVNYS